MGQINRRKIVTVVIYLIVTGIVVYPQIDSVSKKKIPLYRALAKIESWQVEQIPLEKKIVDALELDDYVNQKYKKGQDSVSLYIGYYLTSKKVGSAHSPLVCFPGQGWHLSNFEKKVAILGDETINLQQLIASYKGRKELLIYWFQSYDKTSQGTFVQKLNTLYSKLINRREDNAFVRVMVPMDGISDSEAYQIGVKFIKSFYPIFLKYVREDSDKNNLLDF